jgi:arylsulfatase A-like enzyme
MMCLCRYVIFTSDNGFHLGQHGMPYDKFTPVRSKLQQHTAAEPHCYLHLYAQYESDVRVPFFARGPGIPQGIISDYQATMVDLPATILTLAGTGC